MRAVCTVQLRLGAHPEFSTSFLKELRVRRLRYVCMSGKLQYIFLVTSASSTDDRR